jgi:phosphoesterase RecJ-like protein
MSNPEYQPVLNEIADAITAIKAAKTIVMASHINPDGDALGSLLGLGIAIKNTFPDKKVTMLSRDGVPEILHFLPDSNSIRTSTSVAEHDLAIVLDSGELKRVGEQLVPTILATKLQIDIDHHVGEGAFGQIQVLDSSAAATAEIVYELITAMGAEITTDIASCLLTGIITDTGSFRYLNVTPRTLNTSAALIGAGASPAEIAESVFDNKTFAATKLIGLCLSTLKQTADEKITWAHVRNEDFVSTGATDEDTEGLVNHVRAVRGTQIAILFREIRLGLIRISLRCVDGLDVSKVANQFDGGGHRLDAGCSYHGSVEEAERLLVEACKKALG